MNKPSFNDAFKFWLKLGFISFGGPAGQISIMHSFIVEKKKWISESKYLHALNYCMLLPGPEAQQLATYMGWLLHGTLGGVVAGLLFILPSVFILLGLSILYVLFGTLPVAAAILSLLKPAVAAIVIGALIKISKKSLSKKKFVVIAVISFTGIFFMQINFPLIIAGALASGFIFEKYFNKKHENNSVNQNQKADSDEAEFYINRNTVVKDSEFSVTKLLKQLIIFLLLWSTPIIAFYIFSDDFKFWWQLSGFFTKAAVVTFGGAYAVLPYVAQYAVQNLKWLSHAQMMDGLALGETTPGPLIMVLAFVGFIAGYNNFNHSVIFGTLGLVVTTYYTFLPSFLFILAGAPLIEHTHQNKILKPVLNYITAAVVGVLANLCVVLVIACLYNQLEVVNWLGVNFINLLWMVISLIVLLRFKLNMILWIGISAFTGLLLFLLNII